MVLECVKTCVIHASEMVASYEKARVIALLRECIDFEGLSAIQFCPRGLIRVTFKDASDMEEFVRVGSLTLDGHDLSVTSSDKPMVVAVPEVVPDPPVAVVPAVSDSSAVLDEGVDETVEEEEVADEEDVAVVEDVEDEVTDAEDEDEVPVNTPTGVPVPSPSGRVLGTAPSVPVAEKVQASSGPVAPVVPVAVSGPSGSPVGSSQSVPADSGLPRVALSRVITPELRREFFWGYRDMLCQCSRNAAYVISYRNTRVCGVFPADDPDEVRITFESGAFLIVHANLVRISKADTSNEVSEEEFAKFLLSIRTDPSYRISFRGTIVADVGPTEHSNVLCATF